MFLMLLLGFSGKGFSKEVSLRVFCYTYQITPVYHLDHRWVGLKKGQKEVKLFLDLPYVVLDGNFYRMKQLPANGQKGHLLLSKETAQKILVLLEERSAEKAQQKTLSSSAGTVRKDYKSLHAKVEEYFLNSGSSSQKSVKKKEKSGANKSLRTVSKVSSNASSVKIRTVQAVQKHESNFVPINAVVLDPGHGGKDPGGLGVHGEKEKEVVLAVAKLVYAKFKKDPKITAVLTRHKDVFVTLEGRTVKTSKLMKRYNPVFVSIHANISFNRKTKGIEIYRFGDHSSDQNDRYLENLENSGFDKGDIKKTETLFIILSDLIRDGVIAESEVLGKYLMKNMVRQTKAKNRRVRQANFYVLKYNPVTSVLLEIGFLSNKEEAKKLMTRDYRKKMAQGIYLGIKEFIENYNDSKGVIQ